MTTRIYRIIDSEGDRLIRASTPAQAVRHAVSHFKVRVASQDDIAELVGQGAKIEAAGDQQLPLPIGQADHE